jgi:hypothetical protein
MDMINYRLRMNGVEKQITRRKIYTTPDYVLFVEI